MWNFNDGLESELSEQLGDRVVNHRNRFFRLIYNRYMEILPIVISYKGIGDTAIDNLKCEVALRNNMQAIVGKATNDKIMFLGYAKEAQGISDPTSFFNSNILTGEDIQFTIPKTQIPTNLKKFQQITTLDDARTGDFIVLQNKPFNRVNDFEVVAHYATQLAEIVASRFSLIIQAKVINFFKGEVNNETANRIITALYNGEPFLKANFLLDIEDALVTIDNSSIASHLPQLKNEFQNGFSELNAQIGINSLAVDKESGVSDAEAKGNRGFTSSTSNIYIKARQEGFNLLNKRFDMDIRVMYDDEAVSELSTLQKISEVVENNE